MAFPWLAAAQIAAPIIGGMFGAQAGNKRQDAASADAAKAREIIGAVQIPELKEWLLQQYSSAGQFTPEMMQAISLDPSAQGAISTNPVERQKNVELINRLIEQSKPGSNSDDQAAYNLATLNSAGQANSEQQSIIQNMQARGAGGSGVELAARLAGQQNAAQALQKAHLEQAAKRNELRMQALTASSGALSNLRGADYQQALNLANANDQRSQANWQNQQGISSGNVELANNAQQFNLANRQRIADSNVDLSNKQQAYNSNLAKQKYDMEMEKAKAMAGGYNNSADRNIARAGQEAGMWAGIGQGVGTILGAYGSPKAAPTTSTARLPQWGDQYDQFGNLIKK
jgi:hypothetical protein